MSKDKTKLKAAITALKVEINAMGVTPKLTTTGELKDRWGDKCQEALGNALALSDVPLPTKGDYFGAPWVGVRVDLLGRDETDAELAAWLVPEWKNVGLPGFKSLVSSSRAWCSILATKKFREVGIKSTNSAGASSWSKWGNQCAYWFGSVLPISHNKGKGGRHVCFFLYWENEAKKIAVTMDGNRSNKYAINLTDLSGKGDILVGGPRWSTQVADGKEVSKATVLAQYPFLKPGSTGTGGTTR